MLLQVLCCRRVGGDPFQQGPDEALGAGRAVSRQRKCVCVWSVWTLGWVGKLLDG